MNVPHILSGVLHNISCEDFFVWLLLASQQMKLQSFVELIYSDKDFEVVSHPSKKMLFHEKSQKLNMECVNYSFQIC